MPLNKAVHSSISLRFISLMRHSPHKIKRKKTLCLECKHSDHIVLFLSILHCSLLTHKEKYHPRQFNVRNGTRKCAFRDAIVLWTTLPLAVASTEMPIETSNPAHPESPRAFYISLLCIILCYKNARNSFVYRALRAI